MGPQFTINEIQYFFFEKKNTKNIFSLFCYVRKLEYHCDVPYKKRRALFCAKFCLLYLPFLCEIWSMMTQMLSKIWKREKILSSRKKYSYYYYILTIIMFKNLKEISGRHLNIRIYFKDVDYYFSVLKWNVFNVKDY